MNFKKRIFFIFLQLSFCLFCSTYFAQQKLIFNKQLTKSIIFNDWEKKDSILINNTLYPIQNIGLNSQGSNILFFSLKNSKNASNKKRINSKKRQNITFYLDDTLKKFKVKFIEDTLFSIELKNINSVKTLTVYNKKQCLGVFKLLPFPELKITLNIIPLNRPVWSVDTLKKHLISAFSSLNVKINFKIIKNVSSKNISKKEKLDNPFATHDRYTKQMIRIRNEYFEKYKNSSKKEYYLFITPDFVDSTITSYSIQKGIFNFTTSENNNLIYNKIIKELIRGIGGLDNIKLNKICRNNTFELNDLETWNFINENYNHFLYYDNYEDVRTNSGIVAFYFWEQDKYGNIKIKNNSFLHSVIRPYKKNYPSYYLSITNPFFNIFFKIFDYKINIIHFIVFISSTILFFYVNRKWVYQSVDRKFKIRVKKLSLISFVIILNLLSFYMIDKGYNFFQVLNGNIIEFKNNKIENVVKNVAYNVNDNALIEQSSYSENFIKTRSNWKKIRVKNVLYFQGVLNDKNQLINLKYQKSSNNLKVDTILTINAGTHYIVLDLKNKLGKKITTKIYNHIGVDLTSKISLQDPVKRVLLFANGYRPTSLGGNFDELFNDIKNHGVEYPNSSNMLYDFDRFNYWNPWRAIDEQLKKRMNATDVLYADGHFSVATSNHESLIGFSTLAGIYPKRCDNLKKHTCYFTTKKNSVTSNIFSWLNPSNNTYDLLAKKPNKKGFKLRYTQGKIAGRNLLLQLNELPNNSLNDTISIVAHSMGFAYALGIIEVIRHKINFGGFYIIAPENASMGKVNINEWKQVWQYGSKLSAHNSHPPCLQDGVAAQSKVKGLPVNNQLFFPKNVYRKLGFFDSHFIGNYTWILDIPLGKTGYIKQN